MHALHAALVADAFDSSTATGTAIARSFCSQCAAHLVSSIDGSTTPAAAALPVAADDADARVDEVLALAKPIDALEAGADVDIDADADFTGAASD
jgi:hypothetical protein